MSGKYFAVDYGWLRQPTRVCKWQPGDKTPESFTFGVKEKTRVQELLGFIHKLGPEDILYTEQGGAGDRFVLAASRQGCTIQRIPTFRLKQQRDKREWKSDWDALLLFHLAQECPELFYLFLEPDEAVLRLKILVTAFLKVQEARKQAVQRWTSAYRDLALLEGQEYAAEEIEAMVLSLPGVALAMDQEEELEARMTEQVQGLDLYKKVFAPIKGCGPFIAAHLIGGIETIERFDTRDKLVNFTTYGFFKATDGTNTGVPKLLRYARRYGGLQASIMVGQGVWLYTNQIWRFGPHDWPAKQMLLDRFAKEQQKHPDWPKPRCKARAMRWLGQKLLHLIYAEWNRWLREQAGSR